MSAHKWPVKVTILKPIVPKGWTSAFYPETARIDYVRRATSKLNRWSHQIVFQKGAHYGEVGDMAANITHAQLLDLEREGFVRIEKVAPVRKQKPSRLTRDQLFKEQLITTPEAELQANVKSLALARGWLFYHTHRSDKSDQGYPDCTMVRFRPSWDKRGVLFEVIFAELKREEKNPTTNQQAWLDAVGICNLWDVVSVGDLNTLDGKAIKVNAFVWRPSDWLNGTIEQALK